MASIHHSFDIGLAQIYGIEAALLIHHFQHWISYNKRLKRNLHDEKTWSYQTMEEISAQCPYLTKDRVNDLLDLLCEGKTRKMKKKSFEPVLIRKNHNKMKFDRTIWYAFVDEDKFIGNNSNLENSKIEKVDIRDPKLDISKIRNWRSPTPIPDSIPDSRTKRSHQSVIKTDDGLTDDFFKFSKLEVLEEMEALAANDNQRPMQHNIDYPPTIGQEVYPGVFMSEKMLEECLLIKNGSLEQVRIALEYIQKCPGRKRKIHNWPRALREWDVKQDPMLQMRENEELGKKLDREFSNAPVWRCQLYHDMKKDQKGVIFFKNTCTGHSKSEFIPFIDKEFKKKCAKCLEKYGIARVTQKNKEGSLVAVG